MDHVAAALVASCRLPVVCRPARRYDVAKIYWQLTTGNWQLSMFSGPQIAAAFAELGVTHVVWLPDSTLGTWEAEFSRTKAFELVRVCREGEAWTIAAGLQIAGKQPMVVIQSTGLFESGDALRNVYYDLQVPVWSWIGYRSYLLPTSTDSAKRFAEPILKAWAIDYLLLEKPEQLAKAVEHFQACAAAKKPGVVLMAEGKG